MYVCFVVEFIALFMHADLSATIWTTLAWASTDPLALLSIQLELQGRRNVQGPEVNVTSLGPELQSQNPVDNNYEKTFSLEA